MASGIQKWLVIIPKPGIHHLSLAPFSKFLDTQTQKADDDEGNFLSFSFLSLISNRYSGSNINLIENFIICKLTGYE